MLLLEIAGVPNLLPIPRLNCEVEDDDKSVIIVSRASQSACTPGKHHSLAPLNRVGHKSGQLDHNVLVQKLVVHKMIELSGEHRLNEVFPVGEDDS